MAQIPQSFCPISRNAPFCNGNVHLCAHFCQKMVHCGKFVLWIVGFVSWVHWTFFQPFEIYKCFDCRSVWLKLIWLWIRKVLTQICFLLRFKLQIVSGQPDEDPKHTSNQGIKAAGDQNGNDVKYCSLYGLNEWNSVNQVQWILMGIGFLCP